MTRWAWGGALLWLLVVGCASGLAWIAIDEAGRGIGSTQPEATPTQLPVRSSGPTASPAPTRAATSGPPRPSSSPTKSAAPSGPEDRVGTWRGAAGSVTASCRGAGVRLLSATPANGWRVEREDDGPGVRVKFESGEDAVVVDATCSGGLPRFRTTRAE